MQIITSMQNAKLYNNRRLTIKHILYNLLKKKHMVDRLHKIQDVKVKTKKNYTIFKSNICTQANLE